MKKLLSLLIIICICLSTISVSAETVIELNPLPYDEYMYEETLFISGYSNAYISLGLYYPEEYGGSAKYIMTYSPSELSEGIEIALGEQSRLWPEGLWRIVIQSGDVSETLEFTLCEFVDRTEPDDNDGSSAPGADKKPSGNTTVTSIIPDKTELTLTEGETEKINITSSAKSLTVEIEDEDIISASVSNMVLTVTALKKGESQIWVKTGNNYASINVTVNRASTTPTNPVTKPTEPTEEPAEEPTETPTEKNEEFVNPFEDIENHWAKESILSLCEKGIVNGMDEKTFAPDAFVTRAQFVTMLYKAFDLTSTTKSSPFKDVNEDDWFYSAVMSAYDNRITTGDTSGNFNPSNLVTRQDMATFAHRALSALGKEVSSTPGTTLFDDHSAIKDYAIEPVYAMKQIGIINGMTQTTFEPLGNATRAQAAHIIAKLLEL